MSPRVIHILEAFAKAYRETGQTQPIMIIARYSDTTFRMEKHALD